MNIEQKINNKMKRFVNDKEKAKAVAFLTSTLEELIENEEPSEEEVDELIDNFISQTELNTKFYKAKKFYFRFFAILIICVGTIVVINPFWNFNDESDTLIENGFTYSGSSYSKIVEKNVKLDDETIKANPILNSYDSGDVIPITYIFDISLDGPAGPYYSCNYTTYYNEEQLINSITWVAESYNNLGNTSIFTNTMFNYAAQQSLETSCQEIVDFSSSSEIVTSK